MSTLTDKSERLAGLSTCSRPRAFVGRRARRPCASTAARWTGRSRGKSRFRSDGSRTRSFRRRSCAPPGGRSTLHRHARARSSRGGRLRAVAVKGYGNLVVVTTATRLHALRPARDRHDRARRAGRNRRPRRPARESPEDEAGVSTSRSGTTDPRPTLATSGSAETRIIRVSKSALPDRRLRLPPPRPPSRRPPRNGRDEKTPEKNDALYRPLGSLHGSSRLVRSNYVEPVEPAAPVRGVRGHTEALDLVL